MSISDTTTAIQNAQIVFVCSENVSSFEHLTILHYHDTYCNYYSCTILFLCCDSFCIILVYYFFKMFFDKFDLFICRSIFVCLFVLFSHFVDMQFT